MNTIEEWKKDFKEYVNCLLLLRDDYNGIMEYIDEVPVEDKQTCDNCGQDHKYCEPTNKEQFGFCGNWAEHQ